MGSRDNTCKVIAKLQADLLKAQKEITKLKQTVRDLKKGKDHLIPITEHEALLQEALQRAHRAEMKALAFESEMKRKHLNGFYQSTPILRSAVSEPEDDAPDIPRRSRIRTRRVNARNSPRMSPRFHRRTSLGKRGESNAHLRRMSNSSISSRCSTSGVRESVKQNLEVTLSSRGRPAKMEPRHHHKNILLRMHSMLRGNGHKSKASNAAKANRTKHKVVTLASDSSQVKVPKSVHRQQSLLKRVHTHFFSRRKKLRSIYDLPELSLLQVCNFTKEYETPRECFSRFEKTPLIVADDESEEESGWSTSEEEEAGSSQKQTRKTKGKSDKKPPKKKKSSKKEPPPIPPKPQNLSTSVSNTSLTPPSSPTNSEEKILDNSSFDDISGQKPLKSYKRVQGPQGRRKPIRYSHLKSAEHSENGAM